MGYTNIFNVLTKHNTNNNGDNNETTQTEQYKKKVGTPIKMLILFLIIITFSYFFVQLLFISLNDKEILNTIFENDTSCNCLNDNNNYYYGNDTKGDSCDDYNPVIFMLIVILPVVVFTPVCICMLLVTLVTYNKKKQTHVINELLFWGIVLFIIFILTMMYIYVMAIYYNDMLGYEKYDGICYQIDLALVSELKNNLVALLIFILVVNACWMVTIIYLIVCGYRSLDVKTNVDKEDVFDDGLWSIDGDGNYPTMNNTNFSINDIGQNSKLGGSCVPGSV